MVDRHTVVAYEGGSGGSRIELPSLSESSSPLELGDWLTVIAPLMRDVSQVSAVWWERTRSRATELYQLWKRSSPMDRINIDPVLPKELKDPKFHRTEQRGTSLLLKALPQEFQQSLIAEREMCSTAG